MCVCIYICVYVCVYMCVCFGGPAVVFLAISAWIVGKARGPYAVSKAHACVHPSTHARTLTHQRTHTQWGGCGRSWTSTRFRTSTRRRPPSAPSCARVSRAVPSTMRYVVWWFGWCAVYCPCVLRRADAAFIRMFSRPRPHARGSVSLCVNAIASFSIHRLSISLSLSHRTHTDKTFFPPPP
jgi:hypothetical protein